MVMRNRHDDTNTPDWWDDLPPAVRRRFARVEPAAQDRGQTAEHEATSGRPGLIRDLTRLAILFVIVALANLLFLLIAISFLVGVNPVAH